jgi:hypothetical protein
MSEQWRDIPGYEGYYQVSDLGQVRSLDRVVGTSHGVTRSLPGKVLSVGTGRSNYPQVRLSVNGKTRLYAVHQVVALSFLGPRPAGMVVCHWDGDSGNNKLENLRYATQTENAFDAVRHGTHSESKKTHCKNGHEFNSENSTTYPSERGRTRRRCKICSNRSKLKHYAIQRDARLNPQEKAVMEQLRRWRNETMIAPGRNT